jgi:hypothetical protein
MARHTEANKVGQDKAYSIGEIGELGPIEQAVEGDIDLTAFMEDILVVRVQEDKTPGAIPTISPEVNSVRQNIVRGINQPVKRKYVEAMARSRITDYEQRVINPADPSNIQMVPKTTLSADFVVLQDPHPNGRAWLEQILAQP